MRERSDRIRNQDAASSSVTSQQVDAVQERAESGGGQSAAPGWSGDAASSLDKVDDASDDSFPASDAPGWTGLHAGSPKSDR